MCLFSRYELFGHSSQDYMQHALPYALSKHRTRTKASLIFVLVDRQRRSTAVGLQYPTIQKISLADAAVAQEKKKKECVQPRFFLPRAPDRQAMPCIHTETFP